MPWGGGTKIHGFVQSGDKNSEANVLITKMNVYFPICLSISDAPVLGLALNIDYIFKVNNIA